MSETQLDRFERKFDSFVEYVQGRFQSLETELKGEISGLKTEVAELKVDVAGLKVDVAGLKTDVAELKVDVAGLKDDVVGIKGELAAFRLEVREQYETTTDRIRLLDHRMDSLAPGIPQLRRAINDVRAEVARLGEKIATMETATYETSVRVNQLQQDMQQRFRLVHDRLAEFEKKFAA